MTGAIVGVDITGKDGATLKDKWAHGPVTYLGLMTVGFPNLFMITGPGSPSVLSNMAVSIEQHVDWIADQLGYLRDHGYERIEPTETAEAGWVQHVNDCADITLYPTANSWYMGANVPGKPRVFLPYIGGVDVYRATCDDGRRTGLPGLRAVRPRRHAAQRRRGEPAAARRQDGARHDGRSRPAAAGVHDGRRGSGLHDRGQRDAPARTRRRRDRRRRAPRGRRRPRLPPVPPGIARAAPRGRLLPRRRLGARQPRDRRPVLPRPVRAQRHGDRLRRLPPRARGPLPGGRRRRLRRAAVGRRPHHRPRRRARRADRRRLERRRQPRRRRHPEGA